MNDTDILELQSTIMIIKVHIKPEFDQAEGRIGDVGGRPIEVLRSENTEKMGWRETNGTVKTQGTINNTNYA